MSKPETTFYGSVHRYLPSIDQLHREKMSNPYRGGTADHWYSGRTDIWIEWKFVVVPVRNETMIDLCGGKKPSLSHLQQDWLRQRHKEGRRVFVIIGSKDGGVIRNKPTGSEGWETPIAAREFRAFTMPRPQIAAWIQQKVS